MDKVKGWSNSIGNILTEKEEEKKKRNAHNDNTNQMLFLTTVEERNLKFHWKWKFV